MNLTRFAATAYENFDLTQPLFTIDMIIWGAVIGAAVGAAWSVLSRRSLGLFVKRIKEKGADAPEKAVTLAELGLLRNPILKSALKTGKPLRRYALCANEEDFIVKQPSDAKAAQTARKILSIDAEEVKITNFDRAKFYIPTDLMYTAEVRYEMKGTDLPGLILSVGLLIALGFAMQFVIPELLTLLDNFITEMKA